MENQPSPLNIFLDKEGNLPIINSNIKNQNDLRDIINLNDSNDDQIKKSNILIKKDINLDISQEENNIPNDNDNINILKNRFNDNIYFSEINKNLIYLNPFCNEEDTFGKEIKSLFRTINGNEMFIENGIDNIPDSHLYKTINQIIIDLKKNKYNKCSILLQGDSYSGKTKLINKISYKFF